MNIKRLLLLISLGMLFTGGLQAAEAQTGTGCTNGTDNCENNNLTTVNSTTTTNTNTNTNANTNTNTNNNTNANTNVNTTTTTATNTANNTNVNTNANTNVNTSTATSTATSNNTNTNANTNVNTSTSNNVSNVTQAVTNSTTSNNTSSNTSTSANTNTNTNVNNSTSESSVTTDNTNANNNNINANNTNTNVNQSSSTQVIEQRVKSPPASAIAPSIMSYSQDLCTTGRSGAMQGQLFGFSGGTTVRDMNCERLKLSTMLYNQGMKVASVSILCQDDRVFQAMEMAGTPCPYKGKIGKEATAAWASHTDERPDSEGLYDAFIKKCWLSPNKKGVSKSKRTCKKEWKKQNATQEG